MKSCLGIVEEPTHSSPHRMNGHKCMCLCMIVIGYKNTHRSSVPHPYDHRGRLDESAPSVRGTGEDDSSISGVRWFEASTGQLPARSDRQMCSAATVATEPPSLMSLMKVRSQSAPAVWPGLRTGRACVKSGDLGRLPKWALRWPFKSFIEVNYSGGGPLCQCAVPVAAFI